MLIKYLNMLKEQGNYTFDEIAEICDVAKDTVKNIYSGKTKDPGIDTVRKLVYGLGGSLDAIYNLNKKDSSDTATMLILKEMHEKHLADITDHYEQRLADLKEHYNQSKERISEMKERFDERLAEINAHIDTIKLDKKWFRIATCVLATAFVSLLIAEVLFPGHGWIKF